jgi:hypothetical protein
MAASVVGTWRLRVWETQTADGQVGYLSYIPDGYVFVAVMRADRPRYATGDLLGGTPAERAAGAAGYVTHCGRYQLEAGRVIHRIELSLFPNWTGLDQERFVEVEGDRLPITTAPLAIGGTTTNRLVWERVRPPTSSRAAACRLASYGTAPLWDSDVDRPAQLETRLGRPASAATVPGNVRRQPPSRPRAAACESPWRPAGSGGPRPG